MDIIIGTSKDLHVTHGILFPNENKIKGLNP